MEATSCYSRSVSYTERQLLREIQTNRTFFHQLAQELKERQHTPPTLDWLTKVLRVIPRETNAASLEEFFAILNQTQVWPKSFLLQLNAQAPFVLKILVKPLMLICQVLRIGFEPSQSILLETLGRALGTKNKRVIDELLDHIPYIPPAFVGLTREAVRNDADKTVIDKLVEKGADPLDFQDSEGRTHLHRAVINRSVVGVEKLLNQDASFMIQDKDGNTPLHLAAKEGNEKAVEELIACGAASSSAIQNKDGDTPLHLIAKACCENGDLTATMLWMINEGVLSDGHNHRGETPLMIAVKGGILKVIEPLLERGANADILDRDGNSLPLLALQQYYLIERDDIDPDSLLFPALEILRGILTILKGRVKNINTANQEGFCAYGYARKFLNELLSKKMIEQLLIESGAIPGEEFLDKKGDTPLMSSVGRADHASFRLMLNSHPDLSVTDAEGRTLVEMCLRNRRYFGTHWEENANILLDRGAPFDFTIDGSTPLNYAWEHHFFSFIGKLIEKGVSLAEFKDVQRLGRGLLQAAAAEGHFGIVQKILERGIDVNSVDENGRTALSWANNHEYVTQYWTNEYTHKRIAEFLIEKGAS